MNRLKVRSVSVDGIKFDNGALLSSEHAQDCCESHYLDFSNTNLSDFDGLVFDLSTDKFFNRVPEFGIELLPVNGHPVRIPGYADNNGYYSDALALVVTLSGKEIYSFDITECQQ